MSPRPESFAIYKRTRVDGPWIPYQFYSASCESTYSLPRRGIITQDNQAVAICTDEFSDISPLTGGSVAFSTLEGRPSAFEFSDSAELQVCHFFDYMFKNKHATHDCSGSGCSEFRRTITDI